MATVNHAAPLQTSLNCCKRTPLTCTASPWPRPDAWMTAVEADDLPALHAFVHGLRMDLPAVASTYADDLQRLVELRRYDAVQRGSAPLNAVV